MEIVERQIEAPTGENHGPELFLVHGAWRSASVWKSVAHRLATQGFKSTAISLPGHGTSTMHKGEIGHYTVQDGMRLVAAELERFAAPPVLVVHDVSAALALRVAAERPLAGLVLFSPPPPGGLKGALLRLALRHPLFVARHLGRGFEMPWRDASNLARDLFLGPRSTVPPEEFVQRLEPESRSVLGEFLPSFPATLDTNGVPTLVMSGERSPFGKRGPERLAEKLQAEFLLVEESGLDLLDSEMAGGPCVHLELFLNNLLPQN